jgi:DNA-binding NarL/FixJ family response regulator
MNPSIFDRHDIRICIVEDDHVIRNGFKEILQDVRDFQVINTYSNCEDFIHHMEHDKPNVVLMDIELPGMNGIEGILCIKKKHPKINVIVVTVYENDQLVFDALCAGAGGYLTKNMSPERLKEAIFEIIQGGAPMSTSIARLVVASFQRNQTSPLSKREMEVLILLAKGKSYSSIAEDIFVDKETVRTHIKNIYFKLEVHSKEDALKLAKKEKWI